MKQNITPKNGTAANARLNPQFPRITAAEWRKLEAAKAKAEKLQRLGFVLIKEYEHATRPLYAALFQSPNGGLLALDRGTVRSVTPAESVEFHIMHDSRGWDYSGSPDVEREHAWLRQISGAAKG